MSGFGVFTPKAQGTLLVVAAAGTATQPLTKPSSSTAVRVKNIDATNSACFNFGISTVTATLPTAVPALGSMVIGPNESIIVGVPEGTTHVAVIAVAGTPAIYFTVGNC
jgi:hypothetical protein